MNDIATRLRGLADEHFEMLGDIHEPLNDAATEIERLETALRFSAGYISATPEFRNWHPEKVLAWIKEASAELCNK